eukprot:GILI01002114.1.p1 GENE.GILI01002114.1~~GILI01002114.1.p1  ORF type:complete len:481 (+),score=127.02 GILI01002114.1:51-1445(+)
MFFLMLVVLIVFLQPTIRKIRKEKKDVISTFLQLPKDWIEIIHEDCSDLHRRFCEEELGRQDEASTSHSATQDANNDKLERFESGIDSTVGGFKAESSGNLQESFFSSLLNESDGALSDSGSVSKGAGIKGGKDRAGTSSVIKRKPRKNKQNRLWILFWTLLVLSSLVPVAMCLWGILIASTFKHYSYEIQLSSLRPTLSLMVHKTIRENFLYSTVTSASSPISSLTGLSDGFFKDGDLDYAISRLDQVNSQLVHGDDSIGVPGVVKSSKLYQMAFLNACDGVSSSASKQSLIGGLYRSSSASCSEFHDGIFNYGTHHAISAYIRDCGLAILDLTKKLGNSTAPAVALSTLNSTMTESRSYWLVNNMEQLFLTEALVDSVGLYLTEVSNLIDSFVSDQSLMLGVYLAVVVLCFIFYYRPFLNKLKEESKSTRSMLLMIPNEFFEPGFGTDQYSSKMNYESQEEE